MTGESIGTARIDVTVNADTMEAGIAKAKRAVSGMGTEAEQQYNKAAASSKRYADSLIRQAELLGKTRAEQIAYNAQTRIGGELGDKIAAKALAQQAELAKGMGVTGKSVKELQFAMRGLPAQLTDITVSLAAGQRPLTVLLQQGGQLKDMFGGIGPAAKALGRSLLGLVNPYTVVTGLAAGLGFAFQQAEADETAFNKALITTGNYAGKTAMQLEAMVSSIATTADVTQGSAREALQKVAETGRFTGEQFDLVALAAARMQDATGQSIDDTIKKFEDLGKSPVDALLKLNETEHFLTQSQLDRVRALVAEGNEQEAAAEAARIYAGRLDEVATAAEAARPHLSRMWKEAKEGASGAWEETKKFTEFLAAAADKYKEMPWYKRYNVFGVVSALNGAEPTAPASVASVPGAVDSDAAKAGIKLQEDAAKFKDRYLTQEQEKKREIAELDKLRAQYSEQEYQSLKKQIALKYEDKGAAKKADFWSTPIGNDPRAGLTASIQKEVEGYKKEADQWSKSTVAASAYKATLDDMLATRQQAISLQVAAIGMGQREADQQRALIAVDEDYNHKKAELQKRQQNTTSALERGGYQHQLDDLAKYHDQRVQMEIAGFQREEAARKDAALGARAAILDFEDAAGNVAGQTYDLFSNAFDGLSDALAKFVTTGKLDFSSLAQSIMADLAKMEARILVSQALQAIFGNTSTISGYDTATNRQQVAYDVAHGSANGNVFNTPNLSAYSNTIVDKPTYFAKGGNVMGEAGPEAIMPLRRGPDGKLGVASSGGGDVQVEINFTNQSGQAVQPRQTGQRQDGKKVIIDMVLDAVAVDMASGGRTAKAAQQRFGLSRRGVPVGG